MPFYPDSERIRDSWFFLSTKIRHKIVISRIIPEPIMIGKKQGMPILIVLARSVVKLTLSCLSSMCHVKIGTGRLCLWHTFSIKQRNNFGYSAIHVCVLFHFENIHQSCLRFGLWKWVRSRRIRYMTWCLMNFWCGLLCIRLKHVSGFELVLRLVLLTQFEMRHKETDAESSSVPNREHRGMRKYLLFFSGLGVEMMNVAGVKNCVDFVGGACGDMLLANFKVHLGDT